MMPLISGSLCEGGLSSDRKKLEALGELTQAPAMEQAEGFDSTKNLKAIYFEGLDYQGKPTKVFAWLGMPEDKAANESDKVPAKVPAMVLVHGGGGTAFKEWVEKWNARGYAAISIAVEGQTDKRSEDGESWEKARMGRAFPGWNLRRCQGGI